MYTNAVVDWLNYHHLLAGLAIHELDVVLADTPIPSTLKIKAHSHLAITAERRFTHPAVEAIFTAAERKVLG